MAIELPPKLDVIDAVIDERLASLEDPALARRLARENPSLYEAFIARTQRDALRAIRRRYGSIGLALTAAASIVAGFFMVPAPSKHPQPAAVRPPLAAPAPPARIAPSHIAAANRPAAHALPVRVPAPAVVHVAAPVVPLAAPARRPEAAALSTRVRQDESEIARLRARVTAEQTARVRAAQAAAVHEAALRAAAEARAAAAASTAAQSAPQTKSESAPQAAQQSSAGTAPAKSTVVSAIGSGSASDTLPVPDGTKAAPPPSTGGHVPWSERYPGGGGVGGGTVDSCTPHGGRMGIIMQTIQTLAPRGTIRF